MATKRDEARLSADSPALLDAVAAASRTLVIGEVDLGKTTLVTRLANALFARGARVGVLDSDVGQSEIGPPTTVGLGRVTRALGRLADAEVVALRFVGATSPVRDQLGTVVAMVRLADRARVTGIDHLLVDTGGLVRGDLGVRLKQAKIDALDPDLVVVLDRAGECGPLIAPYRRATRPRVVEATPAHTVRARSPEERRRHRAQALAAYLHGATPVTFELGRVVLRRPALFVGEPIEPADLTAAAGGDALVWGERRGGEVAVVSRSRLADAERRAISRRLGAAGLVDHALDEIVGMLAATEDAGGDVVALGAVLDVDWRARRLALLTRAGVGRVAWVSVGRERYVTVDETGALSAPPSR